MKIELSQSLVHAIAKECAEAVHGMMVQMHLRRSWGIWENGDLSNPYVQRAYQRQQLDDIRAAVRSIEDPWDRRSFVTAVKYLLAKICEERGTHRQWQDYIASVKRAKAEHDANQPKLPPPILEPGISTYHQSPIANH